MVRAAPRTSREASQSAPSNHLPTRLQPSRQAIPAQGQQKAPVREPSPAQTTDSANPAAPVVVPPPVDKNVDLDGDGALSLAEVQYAAFVHHGLSSSVVEGLFTEVDKNRDGYLTSIEFNDIRPLVLAKAENAALRYMQSVDTDHNNLLSLKEAQAYILKEYGISNRDVERVWHLVIPNSNEEMDAVMFSKLRRRIRGMTIRLARQIMKFADKNEDGHIDLKEAQQVAFEQEGISAGDVVEMLASVDDNNDGELNAPEFADFERIIRARAVDTSKKALKVVDRDGSGTLTMDEAKRIAFDHYGFDEKVLGPFFAQADENEDGQLDAVEFAGFRSVIRSKAVKNAFDAMPEIDTDGDGLVSNSEAVAMARRQDDMDSKETYNLFNVADQDKSGRLDKVELADFLRLVRLSAIKFATDHFREFDTNRDKIVTLDELEDVIEQKYKVERANIRQFFEKVDADGSGDLSPGEIVDFRHEVRRYVTERDAQHALEQMKLAAQEEAKANTEHTEGNDGSLDASDVERKVSQEIKAKQPTVATKPKLTATEDLSAPPKRKLSQPEHKAGPTADVVPKITDSRTITEDAESEQSQEKSSTSADQLAVESEIIAGTEEENVEADATTDTSMNESMSTDVSEANEELEQIAETELSITPAVSFDEPTDEIGSGSKTDPSKTDDVATSKREEPDETNPQPKAEEHELEAVTESAPDDATADEPPEITEESLVEEQADSEMEQKAKAKPGTGTNRSKQVVEPEVVQEDGEPDEITTYPTTQTRKKDKKRSKKRN
ncbi:Calcium-dependent protein kinase 1 [Toxocara canis]|uniref:Calcium-dependent protein kinase 1 n=1 Tax=Toxocara canis TaxID=6265 RepID=A0A0B2UVM7_TOXCA|nr:Calcium-dependent protein kinase 1 [Toxocara canis]